MCANRKKWTEKQVKWIEKKNEIAPEKKKDVKITSCSW